MLNPVLATIFFTLLFRFLRLVWGSDGESLMGSDMHEYVRQPLFWPLSTACFAWWLFLVAQSQPSQLQKPNKSLTRKQPIEVQQDFSSWIRPCLTSRGYTITAFLISLAIAVYIYIDTYWVLVTTWRVLAGYVYLWRTWTDAAFGLHIYHLIGLIVVTLACGVVWAIFGTLVLFHSIFTIQLLYHSINLAVPERAPPITALNI